MAVFAIHHRPKPTVGTPVNTSSDYCGLCWARPGREHGFACPAVAPRPAPFFRGLLHALPLAVALDAILLALLIWSLA
ncbi:hypothetical protein [Micromonospora sp. NPDC023644]|uniref:hypothetical protein n=1 Tax=Micromonospora sp. NPDC023644 TaxID=3154321 RepID=UPI0033E496E2